jgi:putative endonuclease
LFHVYVLTSLANPSRYYIGFPTDPLHRLKEHNQKKNPSTANGAPWRIAVAISFPDRARALRFESYLKGGSGRAFLSRHLL